MRPAAPTSQLDKAIRGLSSVRRSVRQQACAELMAHGLEPVEPLLAAYKRASARVDRAGLLAIQLLWIPRAISMIVDRLLPSVRLYVDGVLTVGIACTIGVVLVDTCSAMLLRNRILNLLVSMDDVRFIGTVTQMYLQRSVRRRRVPRDRLLALLPRLETADDEVLTQIQLLNLNPVFELAKAPGDPHVRDQELMAAVLKAYPYVGNSESVSIVARAARTAAEPIRSLARECLPAIKARVERENERRSKAMVGAQLLRGSSPDSAPPDTLLRAADATQQAEPDELLRAHS